MHMAGRVHTYMCMLRAYKARIAKCVTIRTGENKNDTYARTWTHTQLLNKLLYTYIVILYSSVLVVLCFPILLHVYDFKVGTCSALFSFT